jgi:dCTP diphosphatase
MIVSSGNPSIVWRSEFHGCGSCIARDARGYWFPGRAVLETKQGAPSGEVMLCIVSVILSPTMDHLDKLRSQLQKFAAERDWDQFHNPKNLVMALVAEAGELVEHFQWLSAQQAENLSAQTKSEVALEMADVLLYLLRLADKLDIDVVDAAEQKMVLNAEKYPIEKSKSKATKYTKL